MAPGGVCFKKSAGRFIQRITDTFILPVLGVHNVEPLRLKMDPGEQFAHDFKSKNIK